MDILKETTIAIDDANKKDDKREAILETEIKNEDKINQVAENIAEGIKDDNTESKIENERGEWGNHYEYFLTSLGLAVGLGNVWRFPYVCYQNGGGTFLIPYLLCLLLCGLPLYFVEMILGQYTATSCTKVFARLAPGLKGLGYGMLAVPTMMTFYYTVIMAWSFYYMFMGFRAELPWKSCNSSVLLNIASENCYSKYDNDFCAEDETFWNKSCRPTANLPEVVVRITPSEEFFKRKMLGQTSIGVVDTWESYGDCQWEVLGCLALCWIIIAISLVRGMQSYGKLTYFITLFPYVVLTTFLIMGSQKNGFKEGITGFYMNADWDRLFSDFDVWVAACTQIFYSLGVGVGSQLLLCSYNKFDNNCHRDAWLIGLGNSVTSIYAGFVVFGTLGTLAYNNNVPIESVITEGAGLTFQAYPEAIASMPAAPFFSFLFFFMLCLLAMSSIVGMWEPTVAAVLDELPKLRKYRSLVYVISCFVAFLGGVSCCFPSGIFMFNLLNDHTANTVLYVALIEIVLVAWFYGVDRFLDNVKEMNIWMPVPLRYFWKVCWVFITPVLCLSITLIGFSTRKKDQNEGYVYPPLAQALGWLIELAPIAFIILVSVWVAFTNLLKKKEIAFLRAGPLLSPSPAWGPREDRPKMEKGEQNLSFNDDGTNKE